MNDTVGAILYLSQLDQFNEEYMDRCLEIVESLEVSNEVAERVMQGVQFFHREGASDLALILALGHSTLMKRRTENFLNPTKE
jgi:hypothetical protein